MPEYEWPGGPHGLAMWFSGAPRAARLEITEFWHPFLMDVCDNSKRSVVASAKRGEIRWNKRDKATKALAHFAVTALAYLIRTDGGAAYGYPGPMTKTLYNSFKWHRNRSGAFKKIFSVAGQSAKLDVSPGEAMERVLIVVEGAEDTPVVRMSEAFHEPSIKLRNVSTLLRQQRVGISVVGLASRAVLFRRGGQPPHPRDFSRHALGCPRVVVDRGLDLVC